jgi:2-polyprenyl-6-methoxyphenol hydroxylase-like FAD-dependent oxidoreductase
MDEWYDVIVVGARCAGAPLGTMLAQRGLKVAVVEQAKFPSATLSSHVIQSDSLAFLHRLGLIDALRGTGAPFMSRADVRINDLQFIVDFPLRSDDVGGAACIRRHVLDPILAQAAINAGASVRMSTKVIGLLSERGRVCGVRVSDRNGESSLHARLVVGADGRNSTVAELVGARKYNVTQNERWYYWTYFSGADLSDSSTFVFHRWGDRHIFAAPTDGGLYIVGVSPEVNEREKFRHDLEGSLLAHAMSCAPIAKTLGNAERATKIYGIVRFSGYFREPSGPGWVLVGDSGHFKDPAAGRGIGDAFSQVEILVPEIVAGLRGTDRYLDQALARWGRWRDTQYQAYYWLAADIGKAGALPAILPAVVGRLYAKGEIGRFLSLFSHRTTPSELLSPLRLLGGVTQLLRTGDRRANLREIGILLAQQIRRFQLNHRPKFTHHRRAPARSCGAQEAAKHDIVQENMRTVVGARSPSLWSEIHDN